MHPLSAQSFHVLVPQQAGYSTRRVSRRGLDGRAYGSDLVELGMMLCHPAAVVATPNQLVRPGFAGRRCHGSRNSIPPLLRLYTVKVPRLAVVTLEFLKLRNRDRFLSLL